MLQILRAFAWMRWRVFVNSLERTSARDTIERLSLAIEQLGPLLAAVMLIPSAIGLAVLAAYAGFSLASDAGNPRTFEVLRFLLLAASVLCIVGPIMLPASEAANAVRLLLLPIPRRVLYLAQAAGTVTDPWILLVLPVVVALPLGVAAGGAPGAAALVLLGGILLTVVFIGLSAVTTAVLHVVMRNRRRGELIALLFILLLPALGVLPSLARAERRQGDSAAGRPTPEVAALSWLADAGRRAFAVTPSELFTRTSRSAVGRRPQETAFPLAALLMTSVMLHAVGLIVFRRLLDAPATTGPRRGRASAAFRQPQLPGISPAASAVALTQLRLAFRTPRGRSTLLSPLLVFALFTALLWRRGGMEFGFISFRSGLALATFGAVAGLLAILPLAMNQFAVDRAGLTLVLLSPLHVRELLIGKAVGNALIAFGPALLCALIAYLLFRDGSPALWACIPLGMISTYLLAAPAAAALSAVLPRAVDLNSIGSGSNAHGMAVLLGMIVFLVAGIPAVLLAWIAIGPLDRPVLAPALLLVWCIVAVGLCRLLFVPVQILFEKRRENLAMTIRT